ncbi:nuclear transport factor 2 family protein [Kribbella sp. NBC_00709]|uniref:nuclear transport factor 2 family protein n=1 Tax=Kribbella sp. NBC_00709 TaxID=2975972 RepID=UPI002E2DF49A|nr:nuclear transport factor 2 family protein [Kribbella sp. NBC_00709]
MTDTAGLEVVEQYVEFWNATADGSFTDQITYHAPIGVLRGVEELIGFRNQFAEHQPGYVFQPRTAPDTHHGRARLQWELLVDGTSFATGTDFLEIDDDGRIAAVAGFLDRAPEGFHQNH